MIVAEVAFFATMICTTAGKRSDGNLHRFTSAGSNVISISNGVSLEAALITELQEMEGVRRVLLSRTGNKIDVSVTIDSLDFAIFHPIAQKELDLFALHPELDFHFSILPESSASDVVSHAA
jgi:hypothetical protein